MIGHSHGRLVSDGWNTEGERNGNSSSRNNNSNYVYNYGFMSSPLLVRVGSPIVENK